MYLFSHINLIPGQQQLNYIYVIMVFVAYIDWSYARYQYVKWKCKYHWHIICLIWALIQELLHQCEDRWVVFNNRTRDQGNEDEQVEDLLLLVNHVVAKNGGKPYMDKLYVELKVIILIQLCYCSYKVYRMCLCVCVSVHARALCNTDYKWLLLQKEAMKLHDQRQKKSLTRWIWTSYSWNWR